MIAYRQITYILGILVLLIGGAMFVPAVLDIVNSDKEWETFVLSALLSIFVGGLMVLANSTNEEKLSKKDVFILLPLSWLVLPLVASLPFFTASIGLSFTDAYFETVSGVTTTGATILTNLDTLPPGILLWRSLLQWMGGVGIVVMAAGVLPIMQVGGLQLLKLEFDPRMEKTLPRTAQLSLVVVGLYAFLTLICALLYFIFGMSGLDAFNHAMTTMATGGYSTHDESMAFFKNPNILWTSTIFMMVASLPFVLVITAFRGGPLELTRDVQARWFIGLLAVFIGIMLFNNMSIFQNLNDNFRETAFNITSIMTGTGYSSQPYDQWGVLAIPFFLFIMIFGGGAGSTTCGLKMFRIKILWETIQTSFKTLIHPNGVFMPYYGSSVIKEGVSIAVLAYISVFMLSIFIFTIIFAVLGYDLVTAMSAAISALSCVGPGLGEIIGPLGTYQTVTTPFKWVFMVAMILGRLEILTVLILLTPSFWKD